MKIWFPPPGTFVLGVLAAGALLWLPTATSLGQADASPDAAAASDAEKRLQWLNSRVPAKPAAPPRPKIGFRSNPQLVGTRPIESQPAEVRSAPSEPEEKVPEKPRSKEKRIAQATPAPESKTAPAPIAKATPAPRTKTAASSPAKPTPSAEPEVTSPPKKRGTESRVAKATPEPPAKIVPAPSPKAIAKSTPAPEREKKDDFKKARVATVEVRATPSQKVKLEPALTAIPSSTPEPKKLVREEPAPRREEIVPSRSRGRYPWRTGIVTTVFWIGEKPAGNNFTPNRASSWDANWMGNYGGFDDPDPGARRNFIPVRFTPRQNPFYVALPYNDVTRGTTKPEARRVIPWFREEFEREGQSVCRDRWVAIRCRSGKIAYAQWSDCGPFRTDHWEYVFGTARPKPNLNGGAGLDVSPAVRDYLGLDSTDVTDWKFVDFREVPSGPWSRYGTNNTFVQRESRSPRNAVRLNSGTADTATARGRLREL